MLNKSITIKLFNNIKYKGIKVYLIKYFDLLEVTL